MRIYKKVVIGTNMYYHIIIITKYFLKIFFMKLNVSSTENNNLIDTNVLQSTVTNDLNYVSNDFILNIGFKNNFEIDVKN